MKKAAKILILMFQIMVVTGEGLCFFLAFFNYEIIKKWGDFLAPDKNFERLTPDLIASLRLPSIIAVILFLLGGGFIFFWSSKAMDIIQRLLTFFCHFWNAFIKDCRVLFTDIWQARPNLSDTVILSVTVVSGAITRVLFFNRPIGYDEAYTFAAFARFSFRYITSTYYVPNNHVFHTILVRISYLMFGDQIWPLRLPSFTASLFIIVFVYFLGRSLYNRIAGLVAAVLVAFLPDVIIFSVSARGYIIVTLVSILAMLTASYLIRKRNYLAWLFLILLSALGFYTIPMMLYPCGLIFVWLLISGINEETRREYTSLINWVKYVLIAGVLVVITTIILYSPILLTNDLAAIYQNVRVIQPLNFHDFLVSVPTNIKGILEEWGTGISSYILFAIFGGAFISVFFDKRTSKYRLPMVAIFIVYISIMVLIERPYPISRIWLWMIPFLAIWCGIGVAGVFQWTTQRISRKFIPALVLSILLFGFAMNGIYKSYILGVVNPISEDPVAEKVTLYLQPLLTNDSLVVVSECSDARYWYYFFANKIPDPIILKRDRFFNKVYIIAYTQPNPACREEDVTEVFSRYGPDRGLFDMSTMQAIKQISYATIYEIDPILSEMEEAYPNH